MLTVLILTAIVYIFNMRLTAEFIPCTKLLLILGAVAGVIFFITESIIGYEKGKLDAYKKKWDEPGLIFAGITYTVALTVFTMAIANNIMKGEKVFSSFVIGMILVILVHDIINVCVMYNTYAFNVKKSIIDAALFSIRNTLNTLMAVFIIDAAWNFTIIGVLIVIIIVGILAGIFIKK